MTDVNTAPHADRYCEALLCGDGRAAERVIDDALHAGMAPEAVHSEIIQSTMVRIGRLWQTGYIGVADEHLASSICQRSLIPIFEALKANGVRSGSRERVLLAAVEGQHHVLGLRMIADVLEAAGFEVLYLGADVPIASLVESVRRHDPALIGLAHGTTEDVIRLVDSLQAIHELARETRLMVGGQGVPSTLRELGYPCVVNTLEVVEVVEGMLASPPQTPPATLGTMRSREASLLMA